MSKLDLLPQIYREHRASTAVDAVANAYYEKMLELDPAEATLKGRKGKEALYRDYSPTGHTTRIEVVRQTLDELAQLTPQDTTDAVTIDAMRERLGLELELDAAGLGTWEINNIASPSQEIRQVFDLMNRNDSKDWEFIARRMHNVPAALKGVIETLEEARHRGRVAAARQVRIVIEQIESYVKAGGYFDQLADEIITAAPEHEELARVGARQSVQGYSEFNNYLKTTLLADAPEQDAVGKDRYALYSRVFLGSSIDLAETYAWGVEELDRIIAEQEKVAELIKPGASVTEAKKVLDQDPARILKGTDALQAWMQGVSDRAVADLAKEYFVIEGPMRELECMIAPTQEGGIYYTAPSSDFERPGRMWWSVPAGEDTFGTWRETSTVYHEGAPGHHLQTSVATAMADTMNKWRADGVWVSGHGEGWALYAERLMEELGYLADPGDRMGMLDAQRLRAARVVFDIGLHCGFEIPEKWVQELNIEPGLWDATSGYAFLEANLDLSAGQLNFEFTRYLGWPGQAPSYKVGQRIWEQLRDNARELGLSDKEFHTQALKLGSMGLDSLKRALQ